MTEREHTGKKIVDCQIIGPAAAGSAGYVASPMYFRPWYKCFITMFFDLWIADVDVATEEAKNRVGLGCDVVDMLVLAKVMRYLDTKVLGNVYMFQLMTVQCVRILHRVSFPGDGKNYLTFVRVKFHHPSFLPSNQFV